MDKFRNIGLDKILTSVYDFGGLTTQEVWSKFAQKINIIIEHFNYLDKKFENEKENTKVKLDYLLGEGLNEQVAKILLEKIADGTLGNLINDTLLVDINNKVNTINDSLNTEKENITENKNSIRDLSTQFQSEKENVIEKFNNVNNELSSVKNSINENKSAITSINENLNNYLLIRDLLPVVGNVTLQENVKIATTSDNKTMYSLHKTKDGYVIGNITVATVNGANDFTHGKVLFVLDEAYRPNFQLIVPCFCTRTIAPQRSVEAISIYPDGRVMLNIFSSNESQAVDSVYINFFIKAV